MAGIGAAAQLQLQEIDRRSRLSSAPIQFGAMAQGALQGAQTAEAIQAEKAKREQAMKFKELLDQGVQGMQQVHKEIGDATLPDPALFADSRESVLSWYELAREKLTNKRGGEVIDKNLPYDETGRQLVKAGALSPKDYYSNARPGRGNVQATALSDDMKAALEKGMDAIELQEKEDGAILADAQRQAILRAHGIPASMLANKAVRAVWETGTAGESKETIRKTGAAETDRKAGLALKADEIKDKREQRVIDEAQGFAKDTDAIAKTTTAIKRINTVLEEAGVKGGIYTEDYAKVPGYGTGSKLYRDWLNDPAAVKVRQAVNIFLLNKRKETSGSAVTPQEAAVLEKTLGINNRATAQAFLESLRNFAEENAQQLKSFEAGISDKARERIKEKGGITSDDAPAPKPKAGAAPRKIGRFQVEEE